MVSQLGTFEIDIDQETMAKLPGIVQQVLKRLLPALGLLGLLNILTLGIGSLWLNPYVNAAYAAFCHEIRDRPGTAFVEGEVVR